MIGFKHTKATLYVNTTLRAVISTPRRLLIEHRKMSRWKISLRWTFIHIHLEIMTYYVFAGFPPEFSLTFLQIKPTFLSDRITLYYTLHILFQRSLKLWTYDIFFCTISLHHGSFIDFHFILISHTFSEMSVFTVIYTVTNKFPYFFFLPLWRKHEE